MKELSKREQEIHDLMVEGLSMDQIAEKLCVSLYTVKSHRDNIFRKLNIHSIGDLLRAEIVRLRKVISASSDTP